MQMHLLSSIDSFTLKADLRLSRNLIQSVMGSSRKFVAEVRFLGDGFTMVKDRNGSGEVQIIKGDTNRSLVANKKDPDADLIYKILTLGAGSKESEAVGCWAYSIYPENGGEGLRTSDSGGELGATASFLNLKAIQEALNETPDNARVHLVVSCKRAFHGLTVGMHEWAESGWILYKGGKGIYKELWLKIFELYNQRSVTVTYKHRMDVEMTGIGILLDNSVGVYNLEYRRIVAKKEKKNESLSSNETLEQSTPSVLNCDSTPEIPFSIANHNPNIKPLSFHVGIAESVSLFLPINDVCVGSWVAQVKTNLSGGLEDIETVHGSAVAPRHLELSLLATIEGLRQTTIRSDVTLSLHCEQFWEELSARQLDWMQLDWKADNSLDNKELWQTLYGLYAERQVFIRLSDA